MKTKISEKGQVTIPKKLRDQLGLRVGTELDFTLQSGRLIGVKVGVEDPVLAVTGVADAPMDVDSYLDKVRGPRE